MFKIKKIENHDVYYSTLLNVEHFFTTRDLIVADNIDLIKRYLNVEYFIKPHQTHSSNIEIVNPDKLDYPDCDALILDKPNIGIYLNFADCTPVILYDAKNNIASIVHAGWRGTAAKIAQKTVLKMKEVYNTEESDVIAIIGPCISFSKFETSDDAIRLLKKTVNDTSGLFQGNYADLKGINERQLIEIGIKKQNIDICPFCTVLDNDKFFSYRKEQGTKLRHSAVIRL